MTKFICQNCQAENDIELAAQFGGEHRLSFRIAPTPGGALSPLSVGGMMRAFERLLVAVGKDAGYISTVVLTGLAIEPDGEIRVDVAMVRKAEDK